MSDEWKTSGFPTHHSLLITHHCRQNEFGSMRRILAASPPVSASSVRRNRFRLGSLLIIRWPRRVCRRIIFPVAVILMRFAAVLLVFILGIVGSASSHPAVAGHRTPKERHSLPEEG